LTQNYITRRNVEAMLSVFPLCFRHRNLRFRRLPREIVRINNNNYALLKGERIIRQLDSRSSAANGSRPPAFDWYWSPIMRRCRPMQTTSSYHLSSDIWFTPEYIFKTRPQYQLALGAKGEDNASRVSLINLIYYAQLKILFLVFRACIVGCW